MSFLTPLMFAFGLTLPVIVTLYLLKLRRQRKEVPSTLLWLKSIQDLTANAPFQKLRNNLLLWLQLLIALLAVLALARPFLALDQTRNQTFLVLIDNSASMQATDIEGFPNRLEQARHLAMEAVDNLGPGDTMLPIVFNTRTQTLISSATDDRTELRSAINSIRPTDSPTDIRDALVLVRSLVDHVPNPEIIIISDGALGGLEDEVLALADSEDEDAPGVRYLRCGTSGENVGLVAFQLGRSIEDQREVEIYAEALNSSSARVETTMELVLDGQRIDAKTLQLEPEQSHGVVFTNMGDISGDLTVRLALDDDLSADNEAYGLLSPQRDLRVLLVSDRENPFLVNLLQRQDALTLSRVDTEGFAAAQASEQHDLIILDGFCPDPLPQGNWMIFGALLPIEGYSAGSDLLEYPPVIDWDRRSPITRFADFGMITVASAIDYTPPDYATTLVETNQGPLISLIEQGAMSILYFGFDPYQSDWPWLVSYPVFITNAIQHYRARAGVAGDLVVPTGEALVIPLRRGTETLTVNPPSGPAIPITVTPGSPVHYFTSTDEAGIYSVSDDQGHTIRYAVSLLDSTESRTLPADEIGETGQGIQGETEVIRANTEVWKALVWAVLLVLCLEWFIYLRRTWV